MHMAIRHIFGDKVLVRGESSRGAGSCPTPAPDLLPRWAFSYFCETSMNQKIIGVED